MSLENRVIGFIGAGNMAYGLIKGIVSVKPDMEIVFYDTDSERVNFVRDTLKANPLNSVGEVIENCDVAFIAVKPYSVESVLEVSAQALNNFQNSRNFPIFISIAGGVKVDFMEEVFNQTLKNVFPIKIFRVMPNINSLVGKGMSAMCYNNYVSDEDRKMVTEILEMSSKVLIIDEKYFDAVTALSGSGPAYIFLIAEGLIEAGVKLGLPRDMARTLSVQTLLGSADLLNSPEFSKSSTKDLKDMVTSPGGTTAYGLAKLEEGRIKYILDSAVNAAYLRSKGLI
ncbi:MAG: pyrroline-5-carboxylate reductase [Deltaproteobacteria bacterium]|jgi:pyrroline-5-carboxylate reductase|nr:pyrroline-5-carboxylate reductase [Deltaproteobacteria bacterium]MCL5879285.1 pyrroline-5-carboxylate reductase [Deltaproteobacteria bacterium]MDA8305050.1 pyrroline-5-carboxylate reductase [Deltaproteobacteria bacterium]